MRLFAIAAAFYVVFVGIAVYVNNQHAQQRQAAFNAMVAKQATAAKTTNEESPAKEKEAIQLTASPQTASPDDSAAESADEAAACKSKANANIKKCLRDNNIQIGGEEANTLIALSRRGHADFQGTPQENNNKCRVDIRISGNQDGKEIDRLLKDCEVE